jgi:hypothetical protein
MIYVYHSLHPEESVDNPGMELTIAEATASLNGVWKRWVILSPIYGYTLVICEDGPLIIIYLSVSDLALKK